MVPATVATGMDPVAIVGAVPEDQLISEPDGGSAWIVADWMTPCFYVRISTPALQLRRSPARNLRVSCQN